MERARVSDYFTKDPNLELKKNVFCMNGWGEGSWSKLIIMRGMGGGRGGA